MKSISGRPPPRRQQRTSSHEGADGSLPPALLQAMPAHRQRLVSALTDWLGAADAEDVLQEACLKAVKKGETLRRRESALAWFERIVHHAAIDHTRHDDAERRARAGFARDPTSGSDVLLPAHLRAAICHCGVALMSTLRPRYAEVLRRVDLDGESMAEVASTLGISQNSMRVRLSRARSALRARWIGLCGLCVERGGQSCGCDHRGRGSAKGHTSLRTGV